ncbi:hypothetical protein AVEN_139031-1 [Araneus ventricosus]|uniref:Uncharacterized protein n=1 Tax=Araneus ventricosus TaxID=182803 RepID=A0A4Y2PSC9_ARAVE|nr:hypothetical protein AVEN_256381-1 [Araneus ventricosus]GBN53971.1 hypothetical protein AVEN_265389-1 [Araneus ventricosus]GBN54022.1 hypothetical protein AVEN_115901-1 [Araneus ventricosus]GBN54044.1 hypothetical protein AVEN_139031-1 [Araneus ventricosus]
MFILNLKDTFGLVFKNESSALISRNKIGYLPLTLGTKPILRCDAAPTPHKHYIGQSSGSVLFYAEQHLREMIQDLSRRLHFTFLGIILILDHGNNAVWKHLYCISTRINSFTRHTSKQRNNDKLRWGNLYKISERYTDSIRAD